MVSKVLPFLLLPNLVISQYIGYNLTQRGDPNSTVYDTASTNSGANLTDPDVFLNASVHVGEIDILVSNLTAKVNLQAQVLSLLNFNAGVQASIQRVQLLIQNVNARVTLEARLENLVLMINDILHSLDLNPVLATLGTDLTNIVNTTTGALTGSGGSGSSGTGSTGTNSTASKRSPSSFLLDQNILYSVNDYSGNTHTNRILDQSGNIVEQYLDNDAHVLSTKIVGNYATDMRFTGETWNVTVNGVPEVAKEYEYAPFPGLEVITSIYFDAEGAVAGTKVIAEAQAGGTSTID